MDKDALVRWKSRIFEHQHSVRQQKLPEQPTLFELPKTTWHTSDEIDPFALRLHPADFWRKPEPPEPFDDPDRGCIYFIIDNALPLLLYVGETKLTASQRWLGVHDCKDYIMSYVELHHRYRLERAVCSAFWHGVPPDKRVLRQWERELILKWRPAFNKEMWQKFGKPFGKR